MTREEWVSGGFGLSLFAIGFVLLMADYLLVGTIVVLAACFGSYYLELALRSRRYRQRYQRH